MWKNHGFHFKSTNKAFKEWSDMYAFAKGRCSVGSVEDLRTGGLLFDPLLGQYSLRGLMLVTATGIILLSPLSVVSTTVVWERSQWLGKNIVRITG